MANNITDGKSISVADIKDLKLFGNEYPKAFFFRYSETFAASGNYPYKEWQEIFSQLGGIEGKVMEEEVPYRTLHNLGYFRKFKQDHPDQMVLVHYNGSSRDPFDASLRHFAGHFNYFEGKIVHNDIPAERGTVELKVDDPEYFKLNIGIYKNKNEDIGLCEIDADGKPDWFKSEQVKLVSADVKNKTITVERGCYNTNPRAFKAGRFMAAPHDMEGPWPNSDSNMVWKYNFSTECPRDENGKRCIDVMAEEISSWFKPGGILDIVDGIQFDIIFTVCRKKYRFGRKLDMDADGNGENGMIDGINTYAVGCCEFLRMLREEMGDNKLIMADGHERTNQRSFHILNGIESEGFPSLVDLRISEWSSAVNQHHFWGINSRKPIFNYINHKFGIRYLLETNATIPMNVHRLILGASCMVNAGICWTFGPLYKIGKEYAQEEELIWDEMYQGVEHKKYWLGQPLADTKRMALAADDLLAKKGVDITDDFVKQFKGENVKVKKDGQSVKISGTNDADKMKLMLENVPANGEDLLISLRVRVKPLEKYPNEVSRLVDVYINEDLKQMTWANENWFDATFYFRNIKSDKVNLNLEIEGYEEIWFSNITVHAYPDAMYREFENGLVIVNPAYHEYTFNINEISPGKKYRRIQGSKLQNPDVNNGEPAGDTITLGELDGLFLVKE